MNAKIIFLMVLSIIIVALILFKDIVLADSETKKKMWFKVYVMYMKIAIGIMVFLSVWGIMSTIKYW